MSYQELDPILKYWANKHSLHVYTKYKDDDVRSIDIVSPSGKRFQLWIDDPKDDGLIVIHIWDYRKRDATFTTDFKSFESQLEEAYTKVKSWF